MRLELASSGLVTAVGHSTSQTHASVCCGISRFRETHVIGARGTAIRAAAVLPISRELQGAERALRIATPALTECLTGGAGAAVSAGRLALVICSRQPLSPTWQGPPLPLVDALAAVDRAWEPLGDALAEWLASEHGLAVPPELRSSVVGGHASGIDALGYAAELLDSAQADACLLVAVDSACEAPTLEWQDLLSCAWPPPYATGPTFGEAAAALLLRPAEPSSGVVIASHATADDPTPPARDEPRELAAGLSAAVESALGTWQGERHAVGLVLSDLNGERARSAEWPAAAMRSLWRHGIRLRLVHPADCLGDVGAATAPLLLVLAAQALAEDPSAARPPAPPTAASGASAAALVVASDLGQRHGAVVLEHAGVDGS